MRVGYTNLLQLAIGLNRSRQLVLGIICTDSLGRQIYLASRGDGTVRVVLTTLFALLGRPSSLIRSIGGCASRPICAKGFNFSIPLRTCQSFVRRWPSLVKGCVSSYCSTRPGTSTISRERFSQLFHEGGYPPVHWMSKLVLDPESSRWFKITSTRKC